MGINFEGVNPQVKAKLEKVLQDGKITNEELKGLTEAEKEALSKALGGNIPTDTGEIKLSEPKVKQKEKKGFWDKVKDLVKSNPVATTLTGVGAITGLAAIAKSVGIVALANPAILGTIAVGALAGAVLFSTTSCTTDDIDLNQEMYAEIKIEKDSSSAEILKYLESIDAKLNGIDGTLQTIVPFLVKLGCDTTKILEVLTMMGKQLDQIVVALAQAGVQADQIIGLLQQNNEMLETTIDKLTEGMAANQEAQQEIKDLLNKIITLVGRGNALTQQNNVLLTQILAKITTIDDNAGIELLKEILAKLTESVEQEKEMDTKTHELLKTIIEKMDKMDHSMKNGFTNIINKLIEENKISDAILNKLSAVLAKLDQMSETNKAAYGAIINAINNLGVGTDKKLEAILNAINEGNNVTAAQLDDLRKLVAENNKIAQGTQEVVKELKASMSEEHKAILEKLQKGNATLDEIKELLENGNIQLTEINDKLNLTGAVLNNILANTENIKDETKALLLKILAKIPNGCTCEDVDLSEVLAKLDELIAELKKDPTDEDSDVNHEGILTDLDKYFQ